MPGTFSWDKANEDGTATMNMARLLLIGLGLGLPLRGVEIHVTGDPELPVRNLVENPRMEAGEHDVPRDWGFSTARPANFDTGWIEGGRTGKCLWLKAHDSVMSGYWGQTLTVTGGESYLMRGHFRLNAGKILCYAHARKTLPDGRGVAVDERYYRGTKRGHWLVPVFLPPESLGGPDPREWQAFRLRVPVAESIDALRISLGMYFTPGEAWFDDVWVGLAETDLTVKVMPETGESLRKVVVRNADDGSCISDSGVIEDGGVPFETVLAGQDTTATYHVTVTLEDGRSETAVYPAGAEAVEVQE